MASFLRIVRICEERGSGFDCMEEGMRDLTIPAPKVETGMTLPEQNYIGMTI